MSRYLALTFSLATACSADDDKAALNANSSQSEIARETKALEEAAEKTAATIEAETNDEITAQ